MSQTPARSSRCTAAASCMLIVWASACARTETVDLAARFDAAEVQRETAVIDFGTPAARPHLASGWGADEVWDDASFVWALGEQSSLDFFVAVPQPLTLWMRCWPLSLGELRPQSIGMVLNGTALTSLELRPGQAEYSVAVPPAAPLLAKFPRQWHGGTVVSGVAQQVDIFPTVAAALGLTQPVDIDGHSLLPSVACTITADGLPAYSYLGGDGFGAEVESFVVGDRKLIHYLSYDRPHRRVELYDLQHDPAELQDLAVEQPIEAGYLLSLMTPYRKRGVPTPARRPALDPALTERLRALGYVR